MDIEGRIKKVIAQQLGVSEQEVGSDTNFIDGLGMGSLDEIELVMAIEDEFEMEIPDEQAEKITTLRQAVEYITGRLTA